MFRIYEGLLGSGCNDKLCCLLRSTLWCTTGHRTASACTAALRLVWRARRISTHPRPPSDRCRWRCTPRSGSGCRCRTPQSTERRNTRAPCCVRGWRASEGRGCESYLSPWASVPLHAVLAGARVARGHFWWAFPFTAGQWEICRVICQAYCCPSSIALAALSWALMVVKGKQTHMNTTHFNTVVPKMGGATPSGPGNDCMRAQMESLQLKLLE